ncbi:Multidrug export protein EmrA [Chlamydiales bacterium STE3]|nr:Multidrug export protein EmrA [Chlamydiales bacterium STE3]
MPPEDKETSPVSDSNGNGKKRRRIILQLSFLLLVSILITFTYYWFFVRMYETTDDAYVGGFAINLSPQVDGTVKGFYVNDAEFVNAGELLVELDPTDWQIAFEESLAQLALAARQVGSYVEEVGQLQASLALEDAHLQKARRDFDNRVGLVDSQAVSKEDFEHSQADLRVAESSVNLVYHQLQAAILKLGSTVPDKHPTLEAARQKVKENYINLKRCRILAPESGYIAKRSVEVGEWVRRGVPMLSIIPLNALWVDANFKETQIGGLRVGQDVEITTDIYRSQKIYKGKIAGIVAGTGSIFSLLPPQNATGNWIKIVQRVPVRIFLDPEDIKKFPLVLGLSAYVKVNLYDSSGPFLSQRNAKKTFVTTDIYSIEMAAIEQTIERIVRDNLSFAE